VISAQAAALVCPSCFEPLDESPDGGPRALHCRACAKAYPLLGGEIPVLVPEPEAHLARAFVDLSALIDETKARHARLDAAVSEQPERETALRALAEAFAGNLESAAKWRRVVADHVTHEALLAASRAPSRGYTNPYGYLLRDWGGGVLAEREIDVVRRSVVEHLNWPAGRTGTIAVLGAGVGRIARELESISERVVAVDLSILMALGFHQLGKRDCHFFEIRDSNCKRSEERVRAFDGAATFESFGARDKLAYVVGDCGALPVADQSVAAIVSVYFTDVVSLPELLRTVRRVLVPGGRFVHFGPLQYHGAADDPSLRLAADELLLAFESAGMRIESQTWTSSSHLASSANDMRRVAYDNLVFSAVLEPRAADGAVGLASVLALRGPVTLRTTTRLAPRAAAVEGTTLHWGAEDAEVEETIVHLVKEIDGEKSIAQLFDALERSGYHLGESDRQAILEALGRLVTLGVLRLLGV
jgi:SAM-dependent methyltransferase/uncharacterized protein YbaR (Trm112 family)